jgi:acylphosphatase
VVGRVQGVYYRAATLERARELGLSGWVKNLPGGHVEVVVAGPYDTVAALSAWLWTGSSASRVTSVGVAPWPDRVPAGFSIL